MGKFDRYMLSQLMVFFGFFSIVLVLIYWINRAVLLFDWLIASGQSAGVFLEFTALSLPNAVRNVLPISAFAAAVYTTNRLTSESELVVVQANGFGPWRLARPVLVFGLFVGGFVALLVHFAVPASYARLSDRQVEVAENVTARVLTEGRFVHPDSGVTLYIRDITGQGELRDIYLRDGRNPQQVTTYTATRAQLVQTVAGPRIVMRDGIAQTLTLPERRLSVTRFETFDTNVSALLSGSDGDGDARNIRELPTRELLRADPEVAREIGETQTQMRIDGHQRFSQPLMALIAPVLGFAVLLVGGFNRFGPGRQVLISVVLVVGLSTLDNAAADAAADYARGWLLVYLAPLIGTIMACALLWLAANPYAFARRSRAGGAT